MPHHQKINNKHNKGYPEERMSLSEIFSVTNRICFLVLRAELGEFVSELTLLRNLRVTYVVFYGQVFRKVRD